MNPFIDDDNVNGQNSFSNSDLKRLRNIASMPIEGAPVERVELPAWELLALLARLEAAELALNLHENRKMIDCSFDDDADKYLEAVRAWRGRRGKMDRCIPFRGSGRKGYGRLWLEGKLHQAHRISYILFRGAIPKPLCVDHICRNRKCINPNHLRLLTVKENILCGEGLGAIYRKRTHCKHGHPFIKSNLGKPQRGSRVCLICNRTRSKKHLQGNFRG